MIRLEAAAPPPQPLRRAKRGLVRVPVSLLARSAASAGGRVSGAGGARDGLGHVFSENRNKNRQVFEPREVSRERKRS
jgi:hypothetical protein